MIRRTRRVGVYRNTAAGVLLDREEWSITRAGMLGPRMGPAFCQAGMLGFRVLIQKLSRRFWERFQSASREAG